MEMRIGTGEEFWIEGSTVKAISSCTISRPLAFVRQAGSWDWIWVDFCLICSDPPRDPLKGNDGPSWLSCRQPPGGLSPDRIRELGSRCREDHCNLLSGPVQSADQPNCWAVSSAKVSGYFLFPSIHSSQRPKRKKDSSIGAESRWWLRLISWNMTWWRWSFDPSITDRNERRGLQYRCQSELLLTSSKLEIE